MSEQAICTYCGKPGMHDHFQNRQRRAMQNAREPQTLEEWKAAYFEVLRRHAWVAQGPLKWHSDAEGWCVCDDCDQEVIEILKCTGCGRSTIAKQVKM